mmetsp:Transcript_12498/g.33445  ORF Transcript_12498/g.33445 Transcript_12498/m.33445 type:complete len:242 (+) Transcript_12498:1966-2691(+)
MRCARPSAPWTRCPCPYPGPLPRQPTSSTSSPTSCHPSPPRTRVTWPRWKHSTRYGTSSRRACASSSPRAATRRAPKARRATRWTCSQPWVWTLRASGRISTTRRAACASSCPCSAASVASLASPSSAAWPRASRRTRARSARSPSRAPLAKCSPSAWVRWWTASSQHPPPLLWRWRSSVMRQTCPPAATWDPARLATSTAHDALHVQRAPTGRCPEMLRSSLSSVAVRASQFLSLALLLL